MTTDNQPISAARAAALLSAMAPYLARVELYPQWSDGTGVVVRRTRAVPYDTAGNILDFMPPSQAQVSAVLRRIGDVDLDWPWSLDIATGEVSPVRPPLAVPGWVSPVPLWLSPAAADAADAGALLKQRHQLEDPAEPPLAVADPVRDYARSLADGHMLPVAWDDAPCEPEFVERPTEDVPVVGGAL